MPSIVHVLLDYLSSAEVGSANALIAQYLLEHAHDDGELTMSAIAAACNVSKATVSRFCKKIGFEDFYALRFAYQNNLPDTLAKYYPLAKGKGYQSEYLLSVSQSLRKLQDCLDYDQLERLAASITTAHQVSAFGYLQSGKIAASLQESLYACGKFIRFRNSFEDQRAAIEAAGPDDLIIVFSQSGRYFARMFPNEHHVTLCDFPMVFMVTTLPKPAFNPLVTETICLPCENTLVGNMLMHAYADLITLAYYRTNT